MCTRIFVIIIVSSFSYFIFCLCTRAGIQFEWWFYAQSDFILSEVVLFSFYLQWYTSSISIIISSNSNTTQRPNALRCECQNIYPVLWFVHMPDNDSFGHRLQANAHTHNDIDINIARLDCSFSFHVIWLFHVRIHGQSEYILYLLFPLNKSAPASFSSLFVCLCFFFFVFFVTSLAGISIESLHFSPCTLQMKCK